MGPHDIDALQDVTLSGQARRLLCTVLQGFYQSHQASAAAVQVNNLNVIRGMLGKTGCGIPPSTCPRTSSPTR